MNATNASASDVQVATIPASGQVDLDRAVDAAAFETWSLATPQTGSLTLLKIADILDANADELGRQWSEIVQNDLFGPVVTVQRSPARSKPSSGRRPP